MDEARQEFERIAEHDFADLAGRPKLGAYRRMRHSSAWLPPARICQCLSPTGDLALSLRQEPQCGHAARWDRSGGSSNRHLSSGPPGFTSSMGSHASSGRLPGSTSATPLDDLNPSDTDGTSVVPFKRTVKHTPLADQLEMYNVSDDSMELANLAGLPAYAKQRRPSPRSSASSALRTARRSAVRCPVEPASR